MSQPEARHAAEAAGAHAGPPEGLAPGLNLVLVLASLATAGVALWLFWVTATVLPSRDPAHIPLWRGVAVCFLVYSGLSVVAVAAGRGKTPLRWVLGAASVAAIGLGSYGVVDMIRRGMSSGDFEGYIVLMGIVLAGHGLAGLAHALLIGRARALRLG